MINVNTVSKTKSIFFNTDPFITEQFDKLVKFNRSNRSNTLTKLMEHYVNSETERLTKSGRIKHLYREEKLQQRLKDLNQQKNQIKKEMTSNDNWLLNLGR